ncbi:MAG: cache domain-containing protein, partial [Oscillospiraceae bacterium]
MKNTKINEAIDTKAKKVEEIAQKGKNKIKQAKEVLHADVKRKKSKLKIKSVGTKIIMVSTACIFGIVLGVMLLMGSALGGLLNETYLIEAETSMTALENHVESYKKQADDAATTYAVKKETASAILNSDVGKLSDVINQMQLVSRAKYCIITDKDGNVLQANDNSYKNLNIGTIPEVKTALSGKATSCVMDNESFDFSIMGFAPVTQGSSVIGVVIAGFSLEDPLMLDELKGLTGTDFTVFNNDLRVNTTFVVDGERQIGTVAVPEVVQTVIGKGESMNTKLKLFDRTRLCIYEPLTDSSGKNVGMLFTGKDIQEQTTKQTFTNWFVIVIAIIAIIITSVIISVLSKSIITKRLRFLAEVSAEIEDGEIQNAHKLFEKQVYVHDEVADLSI